MVVLSFTLCLSQISWDTVAFPFSEFVTCQAASGHFHVWYQTESWWIAMWFRLCRAFTGLANYDFWVITNAWILFRAGWAHWQPMLSHTTTPTCDSRFYWHGQNEPTDQLLLNFSSLSQKYLCSQNDLRACDGAAAFIYSSEPQGQQALQCLDWESDAWFDHLFWTGVNATSLPCRSLVTLYYALASLTWVLVALFTAQKKTPA